MHRELKWAVLGTGVIANEMAAGLKKMGKSLYAVANRTHEKAVAFADKYDIGKVYNSIDEMFLDENVDIIYSEAFDTPRMGQAIMNRLLKAAGHKVLSVL